MTPTSGTPRVVEAIGMSATTALLIGAGLGRCLAHRRRHTPATT